MKYTKVSYEGYSGICHPIGSRPEQDRMYGKAIAPLIDAIARECKEKDRDAVMVCTGSSGAMLSASISAFMLEDIKIKHIKKNGEQSHDDYFYLNTYHDVIVVDDFICSGETMHRIAARINQSLGTSKAPVRALVLSQAVHDERKDEMLDRMIKPLESVMDIHEFINLTECIE